MIKQILGNSARHNFFKNIARIAKAALHYSTAVSILEDILVELNTVFVNSTTY